MNRDDVYAHLTAEGFELEPVGESSARSRFRGEAKVFPLLVLVDRTYLSLAIVPFSRLPHDEARAERAMRRLLELNREMHFAKFSVDDDGDVVLSAEYPLADLDASEIRDALDVLTFYADRHFAEIDGLVRPPGDA